MEDKEALEFVVGGRFSDFDHFTEVARSWDLDFYQLDRGKFVAELLQKGGASAQLGEARFSRGLEQYGSAPAGLRTFVISAADSTPFKWRGFEVGRTELLVFPRNPELRSLSSGGFHIYTYSIHEEVLRKKGQELGCESIEAFLDSGIEVVSLSEQRVQLLQRACAGILQSQSDPPSGPGLSGLLEGDLAELLVEALIESVPLRIERELTVLRSSGLSKAMDLVRDHQNHPLTVEDICREAGVKARTLQYAFQEEYGLSPKQWLKFRSLNEVRKELRDSDPDKSKVSDIANKWGIWHMGQFARDYRSIFGELPSDTLKLRQSRQF